MRACAPITVRPPLLATVPMSLMDLDDLARLIETHYEAFDTEGRALLPLTKVYWPAD